MNDFSRQSPDFGRGSRPPGGRWAALGLPGVEWLLAWRIVRSKKTRFLSVITVVAITGIAFGVWALVTVLSVTGGFQTAFREKILGLHPHLIVWPRSDAFEDYREVRQRLLSDPHVLGVTPVTYDDMMVAHGDRRAGTVVKGIDRVTARDVVNLDSLVSEGSLEPLDETPTITASGAGYEVGNLVQESSYTVVLTDSAPIVVTEMPSSPLPGESAVTIVHARPSLGPIDVALAGSTHPKVVALSPGACSSPVIVAAGALALSLEGVESPPSFGNLPALASGASVLVVLAPDGVRSLPIGGTRPGTTEARLRVIDLRSKRPPTSLRVGPVTVMAGEKSAEEGVVVPAREPAIILGVALAERLDAHVGDVIALATSYRGIEDRDAPAGLEPTSGRFRVGGIFRSGYYDYDKRFSLVAFSAAQRFLGTGDRAKWLEVKVDDVLAVETRKRDVESALEPYSLGQFVEDVARTQSRLSGLYRGDISQYTLEKPSSVLATLRNASQAMTLLRTGLPTTFSRDTSYAVISWQEVNAPLFQALKLQKLVLTIFFLIIIVVAAFNVVGTQIVMVSQKTREIAILKAMGATRGMVRRVFLYQGLIISLLGVAIGLVVGLGTCALLVLVGYPLEPEVYLIDSLPVAVDWFEVMAVAGAALGLTLVATLGTASRAGRLLPAEGIRHVE